MSSKFRYQTFVAVSGKVPLVDDVLSSQKQQKYSNTSLEKNCKAFEFQTDQNYYVDWRQTILALKMKMIKNRSYKTYNHKNSKKQRKDESKEDAAEDWADEELEEDPAVRPVTYANIILRSVFSIVEVYINKEHTYYSNRLVAHKSYIPNNVTELSLNETEFGTARCLTMKNPDEIKDAPLSESFYTRRKEMLSRADGFMLYYKLGLTSSPILKRCIQI